MFAVFGSIIILVTTRLIGIAAAGMIAFALALIDLPIGVIAFAVRPYQNVDVKQELSFNTYFSFRTITALSVTVIFALFLIFSGFGRLQLFVIVLLYFIFLANVYADVFMGDWQQKGKMRIAGRMQSFGFVVALLLFIVILAISHSLPPALLVACISLLCVFLTWIWLYRKHFGMLRVSFAFTEIKKLVLSVLPLFITGFLATYLWNAQKYYLEAFVSSDAVALYAIILLPLSLFNLVCASFFQGAIATKTAEILASGDMRHFKRRVNLQLLLSLGLFFPFIAGIYFLGVPFLSWMYGIDLSPYRWQLLLLSLGGLARAPLYVLWQVLIMFRKQKLFLYVGIITTMTIGPLMLWLVWQHGITGAAFSTLVIFVPQAIAYYILYIRSRRERFRILGDTGCEL